MTLSFETLLIAGIAGFYLYDSALLLAGNELILIEANGRWSFFLPQSHWQLSGKNLYVPNPLLPARSLFRVCWHGTGQSHAEPNIGSDAAALKPFLHALAPLRYMTIVLFIALLVGVPIVSAVLPGLGTSPVLLMLFALAYLTISIMLFYVWRKKQALGLDGKATAKLAADFLLCAPFALNAVRKISLQHALEGDPVDFARRTFDSATFTALIEGLCRRVETEIALEEEDAPRRNKLQAYRERIIGLTS